MFPLPTTALANEFFQGKSQSGQDLFRLLREEISKLGEVHEIKKTMSISFENHRPFAQAIIRNHSIKFILRLNRRLAGPRIHNVEHVDDKIYDNTMMLESKSDIDAELTQWLEAAYQAGS